MQTDQKGLHTDLIWQGMQFRQLGREILRQERETDPVALGPINYPVCVRSKFGKMY